ncbi:1,3-beta-glucan synthase [Handroanthus impetiginosus]|uniref:1,3-beta-glucan synthase n=1 Tax=Handroanthus impetiginosus TaxID=429701 RepID=A0A2G9HSR7_9LAMI|nr:1,3-beta-glucan synthase [Handroanthus impetiginosus]
MSKVYDDWERLVRATIRREQLWQLCHDHSRTPSDGSTTTSGTSPNSSSPIPDVVPTDSKNPLDHQSRLVEAEVKKDKLMKRGKSRMRLDRWILTRWLSNALVHK